MESERIKDYIDASRRAGSSEDQIRQSLEKAGWDRLSIDLEMGKQVYSAKPGNQAVDSSGKDAVEPKKVNVLAVMSIVFVFVIPFIGPLLGVILGIIALKQISTSGQRGRGAAIAGIAVGSIFLVAGILIFFLIIAAYSNILTLDGYLPSRCDITNKAEFGCSNVGSASSNTFTLDIRYLGEKEIQVDKISSQSCKDVQVSPVKYGRPTALNDKVSYKPLENMTIGQLDMLNIRLGDCTLTKGKLLDEFNIDYRESGSSMIKQAAGNIKANVLDATN